MSFPPTDAGSGCRRAPPWQHPAPRAPHTRHSRDCGRGRAPTPFRPLLTRGTRPGRSLGADPTRTAARPSCFPPGEAPLEDAPRGNAREGARRSARAEAGGARFPPPGPRGAAARVPAEAQLCARAAALPARRGCDRRALRMREREVRGAREDEASRLRRRERDPRRLAGAGAQRRGAAGPSQSRQLGAVGRRHRRLPSGLPPASALRPQPRGHRPPSCRPQPPALRCVRRPGPAGPWVGGPRRAWRAAQRGVATSPGGWASRGRWRRRVFRRRLVKVGAVTGARGNTETH